jgi:ATP-dependent RNA helicase DeaD
MRTTFTQGTIPNAEEICEIQLMKLINKVIKTDVREKDIQKFMPTVMAEFEDLSKEEVIKHFVSAEFNRFIEYYERAGDLNAQNSKDDRGSDERSNRRDRNSDGIESGKTRFFVSIGRRDGLNPGGLLRHICDATGLKSANIGRIDIMTSFSFFEADDQYATDIVRQVNGTDYEGHEVSIEVTKAKSGGGSSHRGGGGGGRKDGSGFGGKFQGNRDGGQRREGGGQRREGGFKSEGGFRSEGGGQRREGGFRSEGGGQRREGGFKKEGGFRSEGGFKKEGGGQRREGGFKREGGSGSSDRNSTFGKPFKKKS